MIPVKHKSACDKKEKTPYERKETAPSTSYLLMDVELPEDLRGIQEMGVIDNPG